MRRYRRSLTVPAALAAVMAILSLAHVGPALAATVNVAVADNVFQPASAPVTAGDTVVWTQPGERVHTVTADDGSFDSGNLAAGQTFSRTFSTPGTIRYYCKIHGAPGGIGMSGVVVVAAAQVTTTTTTAAPTTTTTGAQPAATTTTTAATTTATTVAAAASAAGTESQRTAGAVAQTQPAALARTGLSLDLLAALGLTFLLTGFVFVSEARKPTG